MSGRIRGHYRIDATGRVEPVSDINFSLQRFVYQPPPPANSAAEQRSRLTKICGVGFALLCLGLALMASLPTIQRAIVANEAARMALIRRTFMHSHPHLNTNSVEHRWHRHLSDN